MSALVDESLPEATGPVGRPAGHARLTGAVFLIGIAVALPLGMLGVNAFLRFSENRRLAEFPRVELLLRDPKAFVHGLEAYVSDHFALRPLLIGSIGYVKWKLGVGASPQVMVGRDDWMFHACAGCLEDSLGVAQPRTDVLQTWTTGFAERARWMNARRTKMVVLLVPKKEAVYPEYLPAWARGSGGSTHVGHLLDAVRGSELDLLYPLAQLRAKKTAGKLYYKFDSHLTMLGGKEAAEILLRHLHERYGMPFMPTAFQVTPKYATTGPTGDRLDLGVLHRSAAERRRSRRCRTRAWRAASRARTIPACRRSSCIATASAQAWCPSWPSTFAAPCSSMCGRGAKWSSNSRSAGSRKSSPTSWSTNDGRPA